jgi:hypothetical protein
MICKKSAREKSGDGRWAMGDGKRTILLTIYHSEEPLALNGEIFAPG